MVIRPTRPRHSLSEKNEYDKLMKKSKNMESRQDLFAHRKYLRYALIFGITGIALSKVLTNTIFVKKSNEEEIIEYREIEDKIKLKEFNWMTKLLRIKNDN